MNYRHYFIATLCVVAMSISTGVNADYTLPTTVTNMKNLPFNLSSGSPIVNLELSVTNCDQLLVGIESGNTPVDIVVTDPAGLQLDSSLIEQYTIAPGEEPPLASVLYGTGEHILFSIDDPLPGKWIVSLGLLAGSPDVEGVITSITLGGLSGRLLASRSSYRQDQDVVLSALVFDRSVPVINATVIADVFTEDNVLSPELPGVVFLDDGIDPDAVGGDGVYTALLNGLIPGHYLAEASMTSGEDIVFGATRFDVTKVLAGFNGELTEVGVDDNGDGLIDRIVLQFGISVDQPGTYAITALLSKSGKTVSTGSQVELTNTITSIDVSFPASDIQEFLVEDGPYDISRVQLVKKAAFVGDIDVLADQLSDLGQTQAYAISDLQRPITVIPSGLTEVAEDLDANGLYDRLTVTFTIDTLTPSNYTWSGDVRTQDGTVIGVANNSSYLTAGTNSVNLIFDGHDIGSLGVNGPYQIGNIATYGNNGGASVRDLLGETAAYFATEFEGGTPTFDLLTKEVTELVITGIGGVPRAQGIRTSLLQKLQNAEMLYIEKDRVNAAIHLVESFSKEVAAQSGNHIDPEDSARLVMLAHQLAASF